MAPGVYKIPVLVNFSDQNGRGYQRSEYVGIRVGAKPDVSITIDDTTLTSAQKTGDLIIRVTNKGLGEIKFADVTLAQSDSYELISGSNERYVGNIDSDDYKTARVTITATGDTVSVPVTLTYMDALNTQYNMSQTLTIKVRSAKNGSSNWLIISIVVLVLVIGGYFFFKRRKSR
jgi:LPXTG-motif cell wall-anchored protein